MSRRVYFIKPIGMEGPIKIGCSRSPLRRRNTLATWSPFALEVVAEIEGGMDLERRFHARHFEAHERREWFTATPKLLADIEAIQAGAFDIDALPEPRALPSKNGNRGKRKWTEDERAACLHRNAIRRAEKQSGLVSPYYANDPRVADFIADPHAHGITAEERQIRWRHRYLAMRMESIEAERVALIERTQRELAA